MSVFWDVTPCSLVDINRRSRGATCFHNQDDEMWSYFNIILPSTPRSSEWSLSLRSYNHNFIRIYYLRRPSHMVSWNSIFGDFMSTLQVLIPEVIPSQKCLVNMGPILTCYNCTSRTMPPPPPTFQQTCDRVPEWAVPRGDMQNWPTWSPDLILLEKRGVWMRS
jgi:hypothetical protein